jgi:hypothetical protein
VIPTRHTVSKVAAPAVAVAPPRAQAGGTANVFDDEDVFATGGVDLDLDLSKGPPMPIGPPASIREPPPPSQAAAAAPPPPVSAPRAEAGPPPSAPATGMAAASVDEFEVRALADYGPAPAAVWMTPLYAYRVKKRQPELKRLVDAKKAEAERAEEAAEDALIAFADRVRVPAQKSPTYNRALHEITQEEALHRQRDTALAAEIDAHEQRQAQAAAAIRDLETELAALQKEEKVIAGELAEAEVLLKRAEARVKRADIEIRNAEAQLEPKPGSAPS